MRYVLGIDFQDTKILASIFQEDGRAVDSRREEYEVYMQDGICYASPDTWKDKAFSLIKQMVEENGLDPHDFAGIAACGHPHRVAVLDGEGKPVCDSRLWSYDITFEEETAQMADVLGADRLNQITGKIHAVEGAMGPFILYAWKNMAEEMKSCSRLLYGKDYITYHLTGKQIMDISDASGTMLFDIRNHCWSEEILKALDIPEEILPEVHGCMEQIGTVTEEAAALCGLAAGIPVFAGLTNKASVAITSGALSDGSSVPTVSNSCNIIAISSKCFIDSNMAAETYCSVFPGEYYVICRNKMCADAIGWYGGQYMSDTFSMPKGKGGTPFKPVEDVAARSVPGAGGVVFIPYLNGAGLPGLGDDCKGAFFGITPETTKEDMLRAVLEGACFSVMDCYNYLADIGIECTDNNFHMMGSAPYWLQMLADMTGSPAKTHGGTGGPSLGAAMLAALSAGLCSDREDCVRKFVLDKDTAVPDKSKHELYMNKYRVYRDFFRAVEQVS